MTSGIMEVTVVGARGLRNTEFFSKVDPYVVIQFKNQEQKSTTGHRKKTSKSRLRCCLCLRGQGSSPEWNETFKFEVDYNPAKEDEPQKLFVKVMDHDTFTDDDYLGQATIYVKELFEQGSENGKAELHTQKYRVVSTDKTYHGEIQIGVTFTANVENEHQQENGGLKDSQSQ